MEPVTRYCTTNLDLYSTEDPTALAAALVVRGFDLTNPVTRFASGSWFCGFSLRSDAAYDEPEPQIAAMLAVVEKLEPPLRSAWAGCSQRIFDLGYDCGREPFAFRQELSAGTLARLAAVGATLRITLYSDPETGPADPGAAPDPAVG